MEDLKKAYEILGLPEDATREQVENRYFILLKRERAEKSRSDAGDGDNQALDLTEINRAYNLVLGIESEKTGTMEKQTKTGHFFYYYKFHVIIGIVIVLLAGYMIKEGIDKRREAANTPPANLSLSVFGNYYFVDTEVLEQNMLKLIPDWKRIETKLVYVPTEIKSQQDMAMQQKSVLMLMTEMTELYITDEKNFESLAYQGAFVRLDDFLAKTGMSVPEDKIREASSEEDPAKHPYGIDISGSSLFNGIEIGAERPIIAIRAKEDKWADTRVLLEKFVQTTP
jgi:hypothetical protein